jgi:predicted acetyltransferase
MDVTVEPALAADREIVARLVELYLDEFSAFDGREIGEDGRYGYATLDAYWSAPGRYPFLIRVADRLAGFALVAEQRILDGARPGHLIAEFFVLRSYRRRGVGAAAAAQLFSHFPGPWWVGEHASNLPAQAFWRSVIGRYTGGQFREERWSEPDGEAGVAQVFDTSAQPTT